MISSSTSRDRLGDFARAVDAARQARPRTASSSSSSTSNANPYDKQSSASSSSSTALTKRPLHSRFHSLASDVAGELARTYANLEQLTKLAKSTSMYGDPVEDIQSLSDDIKLSITHMRDQLATLQEMQDATNTQVTQHEATVVKSLSSRLQRAKQSFLNVLETRKESLKHQYEKKKQLFGNAAPTRAKKNYTSPLYNSSSSSASTPLLLDVDGLGSNGGSAAAVAHGENGNDIAITIPERMLVERTTQIESRASALQQVQTTIEELSHIFERVNLLIAQQGELLSRVEDDVERAETHVLSVREQLEKSLAAVMSSKWLAAKLGAVAVAFIVLFLVFFL